MTINRSPNNSNTKRSASPIPATPLRIAKRKRSDSDTSSIGMEDPIDRYRQNLKEQGFIELNIPKALQRKIDAVNNVLERNQEHNMIHKLSKELSKNLLIYTNENHAYLTQENHNAIESFKNDFKSFTQETLKKIFNDKSVTETEYIDLMINPSNQNNNLFHKDAHISLKGEKTHITVIYPMLEQKGTIYISYDKKYKYPETKNKKSGVAYDYDDTINPSDVKHADPKKIFALLYRNASKDLGKDYDDKSLIHAVPEPDDTDKARIFMVGRFAVENKDTTQS